MTTHVNSVHLCGELSDPPAAQTSRQGHRVIRLRVRTDHHTWRNGDSRTWPSWHTVSVWQEAVVRTLEDRMPRPGDRVEVRGRLTYRTTEKDGRTVTRAEIVVNAPDHDVRIVAAARPTEAAA